MNLMKMRGQLLCMLMCELQRDGMNESLSEKETHLKVLFEHCHSVKVLNLLKL